MRHTILSISTALLIGVATACGGSGSSQSTTSQPTDGTASGTTAFSPPQGSEPVKLDPANFTTEIDNPYFPMAPGSRRVFRETDAEGAVRRVVVTVTNDTKTIIGIETRVVHDIVTEDGQVTEDTYDWYAQDSLGNLWYLGEDTKEYENGKLKSTEGSWEAGVDGAQPGIIIPAHPKPGMTYREEYFAGQAEDGAEILSLNAHAKVPYGTFDNALQTRNFTPLEPNLVEEKFYAPGVGPVLEITVTGGSDRTELLSITKS
jgi:ABC-type glycerol-3-phosphate transport system substrate-binding protein